MSSAKPLAAQQSLGALGEHSRAVLQELGCPENEIDGLFDRAVVAGPPA